jgi:hypothetical protein
VCQHRSHGSGTFNAPRPDETSNSLDETLANHAGPGAVYDSAADPSVDAYGRSAANR